MARIVNLSNLQQFTAVNLSSDPGAVTGPVVVPQAAQIVFYWGYTDGRAGHNVLYGRYSGGFAGTVAQANAIFAALSTGATWTALAGFFATGTLFQGVSIRDVNSANQALIVSNTLGVPGTSASTAMPAEVAAVGTKRTAKAGRSFRGRLFTGGWATNSIGATDTILTAAVTAYQNWLNLIATAFSAQGYTHVLGLQHRVSYTSAHGVFHPDRPATTEAVTVMQVRDNHWDTMRLRGLR